MSQIESSSKEGNLFENCILNQQQNQKGLIMWIVRKPSLKEAVPSENIQPTEPIPILNATSLHQQIENIAKQITLHIPHSQYIDMETIKNNPCLQLKKFRESVFLGEIQEGKRNGLGLMLYANGRLYEGSWKDNYKHGKGYQRFSNNSVYKGDYAKGRPDGCGRYQWENGELYQGQWINGLKHGSGIWRGAKGDSYIGEWSEGKAQGYGVHTWVNGDRYEGQFKDCLKHGEGVEHFANGDSYKGNYQKGKPEGYGEYYWAQGSFFKGDFKAGLRCGQGSWKKGPGKADRYEGSWLDDKKHGYGIFTWADGNEYRGYFCNDLKEGEGELQQIDGSITRGIWSSDHLKEIEDETHDEDCELLIPVANNVITRGPSCSQHRQSRGYLSRVMGQILQEPPSGQDLPQHPLYLQPQVPLVPEQPYFQYSGQKNIRPRNLTRNTVRDVRSRESQSSNRRGGSGGLVKKMSVGTVRGKSEIVESAPKSMSSSFFVYKINSGGRQIRTSGGSRRQSSPWQDQLKSFAKRKMGSQSQFH